MKPREILVTRRDPGYLRVHVPPLLYAAPLAAKLDRALAEQAGVRKVAIDRHRARISVHYDRLVAREPDLLAAIAAAAAPLVERMEPAAFEAAFQEQAEARRERLAGKAAQAAYLGLLGWAHWHVLRWAIRSPATAWWVWALLGFGIYTHRNQIRRIPQLSG